MLEKQYNDNPIEIEAWIDQLDERELQLFDKGFCVAILAFLEHISESKTKVLTKSMDEELSEYQQKLLLSRLKVLDVFETHYKRRLKMLQPEPAAG